MLERVFESGQGRSMTRTRKPAKRAPGRPPGRDPSAANVLLSVRISADLLARLSAYARKHKRTLPEIVREKLSDIA